MNKVVWSALVTILVGFSLPASAQDAVGVRIADAAQPAGILVDPLDCLERAAKVLDAGKAAKFCRDVFHSGGKVMEKVANEAADATKSSRPVVVAPAYDGYYGGRSVGVSVVHGYPYPSRGGQQGAGNRRQTVSRVDGYPGPQTQKEPTRPQPQPGPNDTAVRRRR